jgi:folate-dependent phosphoribosylglycinamide formyltransferase PurN
MAETGGGTGDSIRVVVFGGGPGLNHDVKEFLRRLEGHPDIELLAVYCQSASQSWGAIFRDLWQRRGVLSFPLFITRLAGNLGWYLKYPGDEWNLRAELRRMAGRIHNVEDIHADRVLIQVASLEPDLGLIYGSPILKPELFNIPTKGTLGIHHGKVPQYRGNKTTFWAVYNGERVAGVTIQKVNEGLDTGSIVLQGEVSVGRRTYGSVWNELEALGLDLYIDAILKVRDGTATYTPQQGKKRKLYRNPKLKDFVAFWIKQVERRIARS